MRHYEPKVTMASICKDAANRHYVLMLSDVSSINATLTRSKHHDVNVLVETRNFIWPAFEHHDEANLNVMLNHFKNHDLPKSSGRAAIVVSVVQTHFVAAHVHYRESSLPPPSRTMLGKAATSLT